MLPRKSRLTTRLFDEVLQKSTVLHGPHLSLRVNRLSTRVPSRFSFVVSKKIDTRATRRNTIKRRLQALVHQALPALPVGMQAIFFAKKGSEKLTFRELDHEVKELLIKLHR